MSWNECWRLAAIPEKSCFRGSASAVTNWNAPSKWIFPLFQRRIRGGAGAAGARGGGTGPAGAVSLRINPDVDADTHPYISTGLKQNKFGIEVERALAGLRAAAASPHLEVVGVDCHIGSQLTRVAPFVDALERVLALVGRLEAQDCDPSSRLGRRAGHSLIATSHRCRPSMPPPCWNACATGPHEILIEPGRAIVGNAGILVTRVELLKQGDEKSFAVVDAAMNDLLRPALYSALAGDYPGRTARGG